MSKQGERSRGHPLIRLPIVGSPIGQGSRGVCCPMFSVLPANLKFFFQQILRFAQKQTIQARFRQI